MQWKRWMLCLSLLSLAGFGCHGSDGDGGAPAESDSANTAAVSSPQPEPPAVAVAEFLEAVRVGDDAKAASLFTPAAREQVSQLGYQVAPKRTDTATFKVGKVEYAEGGVARVSATWTDLNRSDEMLWMLRSGPEGWRIAGMAATVFEGEPPLLLDFENLKEAMNKIGMVREAIEQREAKVQAEKPAAPQEPVRR